MSPEQMRSAKDVDARADIWALGMILFELLSGRPAFEADTEMALAIKVTGEPAPPIRAFRPDAPTELEAVISRCLEKDRESRYPNVAELALALAPFAPERSTALIERISGIIRAAGLSRSAHALAPPSLDAEWPLPAPTRRAAGRATRGTSTRLLALTGAGVGTLVALVAVAGALVFGRPRAHRDDDPQTTAQEVPQPVHPQAPVASSPKPAGTAAADTTAADAGPVVTPPAAPAAQTTPAPTQTSTPPARGTSRAAPAPTPKAASIAPCKLVTTVDKNGEPHFSCPCATCR
jgi:serine/threonine-protein kinase